MALVQAVCNVLIQPGNVPATLVIKEPNVMLLVVVIQQVQVAQHVMLLLVNALAILDTQEPHVIPVRQIITKQVVVLPVQVSDITYQQKQTKNIFQSFNCSLWLRCHWIK